MGCFSLTLSTAGQIRLSNALARCLADELSAHLPQLHDRLVTQEQKVAGGLRTANADVSESHRLDGLRLAVELKPINLAVGRAIWNRFGDIRTFAVNIHLKFPFAVVGGVLVIPTYEETGTKAALRAEKQEQLAETEDGASNEDATQNATTQTAPPASETPLRKTTIHLIERAIERLIRHWIVTSAETLSRRKSASKIPSCSSFIFSGAVKRAARNTGRNTVRTP